ncbi:class E basic helix-loop-helix protein 40 [Boleophthalmus pectinirostris]|uniref:class E basic helix-loop-helix protein 40 n=1 Tax=Boleophthalmus pectinirostris TaxID=150288 RepID=UPI000A1C6FBF|nr:class E basic helix-loop-helix protein 40 [Boleophthalmus pectinirostris]
MERITSAQPPPCMPKHPSLDISDMQGMDFPIYVYKSRRGMKRGDENKETYKLPHRLIEKKRRDRINECIAQLKDLLPEHLKLTTLGHLEKAVVLELTLKHVKALSAVLEQQQQKIIALQKDLQISDHGGGSSVDSEEMFRSGFHLCAKEVLHYLGTQESRELNVSHVISHIHKVAAEVLHHQGRGHPEEPPALHTTEKKAVTVPPQAQAKNCVPVIQRTHPHGTGEQSGSDTDTDSGYGGEQDKRDQSNERVKQEGNEPPTKKSKLSEETAARDSYINFSPNQPPFCLPFYLIPPTAAAAASAYLPMLDKCWYPGGMPVMYPCVSGLPQETLPSSSLVLSPRSGSPQLHHTSMDSTLHKALKNVSPLNVGTKD